MKLWNSPELTLTLFFLGFLPTFIGQTQPLCLFSGQGSLSAQAASWPGRRLGSYFYHPECAWTIWCSNRRGWGVGAPGSGYSTRPGSQVPGPFPGTRQEASGQGNSHLSYNPARCVTRVGHLHSTEGPCLVESKMKVTATTSHFFPLEGMA